MEDASKVEKEEVKVIDVAVEVEVKKEDVEKIEQEERLKALSKRYDKGYYDRNYGNYGDADLWVIMTEILIRKWGRKPKKLVDFGCADGWLVKHFRNRGVETFGVEVSEYAIEKSGTVGVIGKPRIGRGEVRYDDVCYGAEWVISFETLEHIEELEIDKYIRSFYDVTKKGFVGSIYLGNHSRDETHVLIKDRRWWIKRFERNGFVNVPIKEMEVMNYPIVREFGLEIFWFEKE